jgi:hypothetical protein
MDASVTMVSHYSTILNGRRINFQGFLSTDFGNRVGSYERDLAHLAAGAGAALHAGR